MNTTKTEVDLSANYIDVRDIIARVEELREQRDGSVDEQEDGSEIPNPENWASVWPDDAEELSGLEKILRELAGNGGDEQWEGVWYPVTLIRDGYFETAMDDLLEDIGDLPKNLPCYLTITVDYDALRMDYTSIEINGTDYWYR